MRITPASRSPRLSIIIPALNEARRLPPSLENIVQFLADKNLPAEIVVVDNGSTDGTGDSVREFACRHREIPIEVIVESTRGKGAAVRTGMLHGTGDALFLCDADLSMPIEELDKFIAMLETNVDIVIGSREGIGARRCGEPLIRHLMGRMFNRLVQTFTLTGLADTQCGFKLFRKAVAHDLFSRQTICGWGFDVEILSLARHRGYSLTSVPIAWNYDSDSRVRPIRDTLAILRDLWMIHDRLRRSADDRISTASPEIAKSINAIGQPPKAKVRNRAA